MSELPANWVTAPVLEISDLVRGVTYSKADARDIVFDGSIPVLRANNIQDRAFDLSNLIHVPSSVVSCAQRITKGDVVIATSSGSINLVGKAAQASHDMNSGFGAFCGLLRPSDRIDARYFGHYFSTHAYRTAVSEMSRGVNINNLKRDHFQALELPLAPLPEQKRIADKLDAVLVRVDACRDRLDRIPAILKRFRQSVLAAATTGKLTEDWRVENETADDAWKSAKGTEVFSFITSGSRGWAGYYADSGAIFLRIGNLDHETISLDLSKIQYVNPPEGAEGSRTRVQLNDILISITADVGMVGLISEPIGDAYINQHICSCTTET